LVIPELEEDLTVWVDKQQKFFDLGKMPKDRTERWATIQANE